MIPIFDECKKHGMQKLLVVKKIKKQCPHCGGNPKAITILVCPLCLMQSRGPRDQLPAICFCPDCKHGWDVKIETEIDFEKLQMLEKLVKTRRQEK